MIYERVEAANELLKEREMVDELTEFIESNPDARELKRATSVKMYQQGYKHREITEILGVVSGFISKWTQIYEQKGVAGLLLAYKGSTGYLNQSQRQEIILWLKSKSYWNLTELQDFVKDHYDVVFESKQSYYQLFEDAGISWKKTQKRNPKENPILVQKKNRKLWTG
jgi:putative transposase